MENRQTTSKKRIIHEEIIIRDVDYDNLKKKPKPYKKQSDKTSKSIELEPSKRKVIITIKPKPPILKTLYIAEKNRNILQKKPDKCGSRLAFGDHSSSTTGYINNNTSILNTSTSSYTYFDNRKRRKHKIYQNISSSSINTKNSVNIYQDSTKNIKKGEPCSVYLHLPQIAMTIPKIEKSTIFETHQDKSGVNIPLTVKLLLKEISPIFSEIKNINKRISYLEENLLKQDMVLRSINHRLIISSSDEETNKKKNRSNSNDERPGCSYVEYSHIPETSGFQRQSKKPLSNSQATSMEKEHNSEQYAQDFNLYDNVTSRGRRQCASVPCKRNDTQKNASERVHKIRHKLNPVRDYRLMDTVHYLAQGEFAPRDDGIKLTPSREAVLSDIIWEDVCRTHWPNTRLGRRTMHSERCSTRSDLQTLIDSLLRERVAHIERRRRRHYRVVKLNHRQENCTPLGKIGDIIVASNKSHQNCDDKNCLSDHEYLTERKRSNRRLKKSKEKLIKVKHRARHNDCSPGPSCTAHLPTTNKDATCCYQTKNSKEIRVSNIDSKKQKKIPEPSSNSSINTIKQPRFVIKKNSSQKRYRSNEPNLEHFILLPTLVVRTPSNVKRQKKFNELYHRILNIQMKKAQTEENSKILDQIELQTPTKKDIGFNINISLSESKEKLNKK